ncbi:TIGR01459 family HAD-type hydrolase [Amorphus sp. MBR-141]
MTHATPDFPAGLSALAPDYEALLVDVWGVVHNGVTAFAPATDALARFRRETGGPVVLITNAPRPAAPIVEQLGQLGVPADAFDAVVTSGDVTRGQITRLGAAALYHIGPERDLSLYDGLDVRLVGAEDAEAICCTGLFDDYNETPEDYRERLSALAGRGLPLVCANPDLVVQRGADTIYCAGALASLYAELGGEVRQAGKPHAPIYEAAFDRLAEVLGRAPDRDRVLAIGDGLMTDIKGAVGQGVAALLITAGIHSAEFGAPDAPDPQMVADRLGRDGLAVRAVLPRLAW